MDDLYGTDPAQRVRTVDEDLADLSVDFVSGVSDAYALSGISVDDLSVRRANRLAELHRRSPIAMFLSGSRSILAISKALLSQLRGNLGELSHKPETLLSFAAILSENGIARASYGRRPR